MIKLTKQKHLLNVIKNALPLGLIFVSFWQRSVLLRQIALYAPQYPDRPVGVDGYPFYLRFLLLQEGNLPSNPDGNFPLFIYFLNTLQAIFNYPVEQVVIPYLVQNLLGLVAAAFTYKIGTWLFSRNVGLLSCFAVLFYGRIINYTLAYANAIPILFFFTGSIFFVLAYQRTNRLKYLWIGSLFLGLSALGRSTTLTQIGIFTLWFFLLKSSVKKIVVNLAVMLCLVFAIIALPIFNNYRIYHQIVFINRNGALNLLIGNNPESQGQYYFPIDFTNAIKLEQRSYEQAIVDYIIEHPTDWGLLLMKKLVIFFTFPWWRVGYLSDPSPMWVVFWLTAAVICLFYAVKLFTPYRSILHLTILGYAVPIIVFFVEERFRIPILPMMFIFVFAVAVEIGEFISNRLRLTNTARLTLLFSGLLGVIVIYAIYPQQKVGQGIGEIHTPPIYGGMTIGQSFRSPCSNLYRIDVKIRTNNSKISQLTTFHLKEGNVDGSELYSKTLDTYNIRRANYTSFIFPDIPDSAGKTYTFFFDTASMQSRENGLVSLVEPDIPVDTVKSGSVLFNGQKMPGDLTFFAYCRGLFNHTVLPDSQF